MKATAVRYEHLFNLAPYEHVKLSVEYQVEEGETALQVMDHARSEVFRMAGQDRKQSITRLRLAKEKHEQGKQQAKTIKELATASATNSAKGENDDVPTR